MDESHGLEMFYALRDKNTTNQLKLQGGKFQLDWTAFDEEMSLFLLEVWKENIDKYLAEISTMWWRVKGGNL